MLIKKNQKKKKTINREATKKDKNKQDHKQKKDGTGHNVWGIFSGGHIIWQVAKNKIISKKKENEY